MSEIDYNTSYNFDVDPFSEKPKEQFEEKTVVEETPVEKQKAPVEKPGCKIFFIVLLYLIVKEFKLEFLIDTGFKKLLFVVVIWFVLYDAVNKVIGFEKNVCSYFF